MSQGAGVYRVFGWCLVGGAKVRLMHVEYSTHTWTNSISQARISPSASQLSRAVLHFAHEVPHAYLRCDQQRGWIQIQWSNWFGWEERDGLFIHPSTAVVVVVSSSCSSSSALSMVMIAHIHAALCCLVFALRCSAVEPVEPNTKVKLISSSESRGGGGGGEEEAKQ